MTKYIFGVFFSMSFIALIIGLMVGSINYKHPIEQAKTFKVECKSFDFNGEVYRDENKFYQLIDSAEVLIPLGDCLLREFK